MLNSLLNIRNRGIPMHLYSIDINPMKSFEFIINGSDEHVRMYDKRNLSQGPVKIFQIPTVTVNILKIIILTGLISSAI